MKHICTMILFLLLTQTLQAQQTSGKTNFIIGLSAPELLHAGINYRIANVSLIGLSAGAGPTMDGLWPTISFEHRLYVGRNSERSGQKFFFIRQGTTFFPSAISGQRFTFNFTAGKDIVFKNSKNGFTIDAGVFYLPDSEGSSVILVRSLDLWPALRFAFYFGK